MYSSRSRTAAVAMAGSYSGRWAAGSGQRSTNAFAPHCPLLRRRRRTGQVDVEFQPAEAHVIPGMKCNSLDAGAVDVYGVQAAQIDDVPAPVAKDEPAMPAAYVRQRHPQIALGMAAEDDVRALNVNHLPAGP